MRFVAFCRDEISSLALARQAILGTIVWVLRVVRSSGLVVGVDWTLRWILGAFAGLLSFQKAAVNTGQIGDERESIDCLGCNEQRKE